MMRNCEGGTVDAYLCPMRRFDDASWELVEAYRLFSSLGVLPYGGATIEEEPAFIVEAFAVCREMFEAVAEQRQRNHLEEVIGRVAEALSEGRR